MNVQFNWRYMMMVWNKLNQENFFFTNCT